MSDESFVKLLTDYLLGISNAPQLSAGAGSAQASSAAGAAANGGGCVINSGATTSTSSLTFSTPLPITPEESKELEILKQMHADEQKQARLSIFKALPSEVRQGFINHCEATEALYAMSALHIPYSDRLRELDLKNRNTQWGGFTSVGVQKNATFNTLFHTVHPENGPIFPTPLPVGVSLSDLKQAHLEASMEETIVSSSSNE